MNTKKQEKFMNRRKSGFTLIEILLVVVIIGILAGIGIPALSGKSEKAKWTWDRKRLYNYHCTIKIQWNPIYIEKADPRCSRM